MADERDECLHCTLSNALTTWFGQQQDADVVTIDFGTAVNACVDLMVDLFVSLPAEERQPWADRASARLIGGVKQRLAQLAAKEVRPRILN